MRYKLYVITICVFIFLLSSFLVKNVYAYIDLGTGSYIFQMLISVIIGALFAVKIFWSKIIMFIKKILTALVKK